MAQKIIGLDIGSWSIKAALLESSLRKVSLVELREHHLPVDAHGQVLPGELAAALRATLAKMDIDVVATAVPSVQILTRELKLPFSDEKRIAQVLGFQLESQLPRPIESVVYDWHLMKKEPDGALLLCPAADKAWLEGWMGELKAAGVDPRYVTLTALAMQHVVPHLDVDSAALGGRPWAILDLGHRSTQLTLIANGRVEGFRTLSRGGHQVTQAVGRALGVNYTDAEHAKHSQLSFVGAAAQTPLAQAAGQALEPLFREIKLTIDRFAEREFGRVAEVVMIGGAARVPGLDALLSRMLSMPVGAPRKKGPFWGGTDADPDHVEIGLSAAALGLEHVAEGGHRVNFRRSSGGLADFSALRAKAGWIAAFLALLLVLFFVRKQLRIGTLEDQQALLGERLDKYAKEVLGDAAPKATDIATRFRAVKTLVTEPPENELEQVYPGMTAFKAFYEITRAQDALNDKAMPPEPEPPDPDDPDPLPTPPSAPDNPADRRQIELASLHADMKAVTVAGIGFDIGTIEDFAARLRQNSCFKKVELKETKKTNRNPTRASWLDFTIKIEVKCDTKSLGTTGPATAAATPMPTLERPGDRPGTPVTPGGVGASPTGPAGPAGPGGPGGGPGATGRPVRPHLTGPGGGGGAPPAPGFVNPGGLPGEPGAPPIHPPEHLPTPGER